MVGLAVFHLAPAVGGNSSCWEEFGGESPEGSGLATASDEALAPYCTTVRATAGLTSRSVVAVCPATETCRERLVGADRWWSWLGRSLDPACCS